MDITTRFASALTALDIDTIPPSAGSVLSEVRDSLSLRETNLIFRATASQPRVLDELWAAVRPAVAEGRFHTTAADLTPIDASRPPKGSEPFQLLATQHPITARLLVLARAWRHLVIEDPADLPSPMPSPRTPQGDGPAAEVARELGLPLVPTIFARVEPWPEALEVIRQVASASPARSSLADEIRAVTHQVDATLSGWPWPPPGMAPMRPGWPLATVLTGFADGFLPTVHTLVGRTVAAWPTP